MYRKLSIIGLALVVAITVAVPAWAGIDSRGGSNFAWYQVDSGSFPECYGILKNWSYYDPSTGTYPIQNLVSSELTNMYNAGQQRLRLPVYYSSDAGAIAGQDSACASYPASAKGYFLDATGGDVDISYKTALQQLMTMARNIGFVEIYVGFFPQGINIPYDWTSWDEDTFQIDWNIIVNMRPYIVASGAFYRIDLCNECVPLNGQAVQGNFVYRLWGNYNYVYGKGDTFGVSIPGPRTQQDIQYLASMYSATGYGHPNGYDYHIYGDSPVPAGQDFINFHNALNSIGDYYAGVVIGEAWNNDNTEAQELNSAINSTGRNVFYLCQWPENRDGTMVEPTTYFNAYEAWGF